MKLALPDKEQRLPSPFFPERPEKEIKSAEELLEHKKSWRRAAQPAAKRAEKEEKPEKEPDKKEQQGGDN